MMKRMSGWMNDQGAGKGKGAGKSGRGHGVRPAEGGAPSSFWDGQGFREREWLDPWSRCEPCGSSPSADYTELVLIVDKSGSMCGMEDDTIGGINALLAKHRESGVPTLVTVVLFDHHVRVLANRRSIDQVPQLTADSYEPGGCTALLDAVGTSISHMRQVQACQPKGFEAANLIFVITTDGFENSSSHYTYAQVKSMIGAVEEEGWTFMFLGANMDAAQEAARIGIDAQSAASYVCDAAGSAIMFDAVSTATVQMSSAPRRQAREARAAEWKDQIERDHAARG